LNGLSFQTRAAKSNCIAATRKDLFDGNGRAYRMNWSLGDHQCSDEVKEKYQVCREHCAPDGIVEGIAGADCTTTEGSTVSNGSGTLVMNNYN
jgi:hypothetical protein